MITNQKELRALFWEQHPNLDKKRIRDYSGKGLMYVTDTRCTFVDWVDYMQRSGQITEAMADKVTL